MVDNFSKRVEAAHLLSHEAGTIANAIMSYWRSNGRTNRSLSSLQRVFIATVNNDIWDELMSYGLLADKCTVYQSTGFSPALLMFGREPHILFDLQFPPRYPTPHIFTARLAASLYNTQTPIKNTKNASEIAWLMGRPINQAIQSGFTNPTLPHTKLDDLHSGPFVVVQSRPNIAYRTRPVSDLFAFPLTVLFNRLKPGLGKTYNTDTEDLTWEADIPVHHTVEFPHNTPPPQQHRGQCFSEQRGSVTHTTFHVIEHYSCLSSELD
ncbi:unnamed protein product [Mesocestoides corti]|uniref:Uncharacterized protein n=1 Tax=Mesocestoides corti TaxID=53468 RepID=A0A0R3UFQ9_MESCO|nr:unnamed protein product [Mesocestoides corti]